MAHIPDKAATEEQILRDMKSSFEEIFGGDGARTFFAPGRVNLIGEHTDYNGGHVFPCALSFGTYALARRREDRTIRFASLNIGGGKIFECSLDDLHYRKEADWTNYANGVVWAFGEAGHPVPSGLDVLYFGNIPAGAGLSSSASLEVLTGIVLREMFDLQGVSQIDLALLGQKAENQFVGMNCGIMDQFASAMGKKNHAIYLDAATLTYEYAPLDLRVRKIERREDRDHEQRGQAPARFLRVQYKTRRVREGCRRDQQSPSDQDPRGADAG